jgi:hypothetical protein
MPAKYSRPAESVYKPQAAPLEPLPRDAGSHAPTGRDGAPPPPGDQRVTAYHEASHAVCIVRLGGTVERVDIIPKDARAGLVTFNLAAFYDRRERIEARILIALAGAAGECLAGNLDLDGIGPDPDFNRAIDDALEFCTARGLTRFMNTRVARCLAILVAHRDEVRRVARALLDRRELSGAEVEAIIKKPTRREGTP